MSEERRTELLALLRELAEVFHEAGDDRWCRDCCTLIDSNWHWSTIARAVASWNGGMGSLNDYWVGLTGDQDRFERIRSRMFEIAHEMLRDTGA